MLTNSDSIERMELEEVYKYLVFRQSRSMQDTAAKEKYLQRPNGIAETK